MSYLRLTERVHRNNEFRPLIDGEVTYRELLDALRNAKRFIYIATWYLDPDLELTRTGKSDPMLGEVLIDRAKANVDVKVLVWNHAAVGHYVFGYLGEYFRPDLRDFRRVLKKHGAILQLAANRYEPGDRHFATGSHHQKFWVMDQNGEEPVGFLGGLNLGQYEWDTAKHLVYDERRKLQNWKETGLAFQEALERLEHNPLGAWLAKKYAKHRIAEILDERFGFEEILKPVGAVSPEKAEALRECVVDYSLNYLLSLEPCPPRHDVFCMMRGPVVSELIDEFYWRWWHSTGQELKALCKPPSPRKAGTTVQIASTVPGRRYDILKSYLFAIAQAKNYIYLENQYFVSRILANAIAERLVRCRNLKVIIVLPDKAEDAFVGPAIAKRQDKLIRWLRHVALEANKGEERVHMFTLLRWNTETQKHVGIYVHAKIGIIDDRWVTIGSANLTHRSFTLDSELNAFLDDPRQAIRFRKALWSEHLEKEEGDVEDVGEAIKLMVKTATANKKRTSGELEGRLSVLDPMHSLRPMLARQPLKTIPPLLFSKDIMKEFL